MPSFHSIEEQNAFEETEEAYDKFLEVRDKCREDWNNQDVENEF